MAKSWLRYRSFLYVLPLCVAALLFQVTYTVVIIRTMIVGASIPDSPFLADPDGTVNAVSVAAQKAGLHKGDRVIAFAGSALESQRDLYEQVDRHRPGDPVSIAESPQGPNYSAIVSRPH